MANLPITANYYNSTCQIWVFPDNDIYTHTYLNCYTIADLVLQVLNDSTIIIREGEPIRTVCLVMGLSREIGRDFSIEIRTSMDTASKSRL